MSILRKLPRTLRYIFIVFTFISFNTIGQVVYTPLYSDIYDFLDRQSLKQTISPDDEVKPYSRKYIASLLVEIEKEKDKLNSLELEELEFFQKEYAYELSRIKKDFTKAYKSSDERWYLFSYGDSLFSMKLSLIAGYGISTTGNNFGRTRWIGGSVFGTYSNWFGASFDLRDRGEFGDNVDIEKNYTLQSGAYFKSAPDGIEYSDVKGSMMFDWGWGNAGIIKDYFTWGHGRFGQLIFSDKSPSFPHIRLNLKPVKWLRFYYFHGWLNSRVIDSSKINIEYPESIEPREKKAFINKYVAANLLTVTPSEWLNISIGNAFVYSGDLRPEMFIPFLFYKFLDHNTGRGSVNDGNGTIYFDVSVNYLKDFQFYSTLFLDVTEIRNVLEQDFSNTWYGYTIGGKKVDLFLENLDITLEYTRINPWVYEHKYQTTTYKHLDYDMGYWAGQNSENIKIQLNYRLLRGLKFIFSFEQRKKGGLEDIYFAYGGVDEIDLPFLYPPLRKDKIISSVIRFEYMHDLIIEGTYTYSDISDDDVGRTQSFLMGKKHAASLILYYGM